MKSVSVVVPIFNEQDNVLRLYSEILSSCQAMGRPYEIIFVDDGSTDATAKRIRTLSPIKYIRLRKNFGQSSAMDAGIHAAKNDYIITLDGDLQNDPADFGALVAYLEENSLDIVSGWRKTRKDTFGKRFASRAANFLRHIIVHDGIHDSGCSLKIYRRECFEDVNLYGEMHRFIPALLKIKGFSVGELVVNHRPRVAGKTKYNWTRGIKGFVDMISLWFWAKYVSRPMHLMGTGGIILSLASAACAAVTVIKYFQRGKISDTGWPLLTVLIFMTALLMFVMGLLGDILSRTYREATGIKGYSIKSTEEL